jgi:hypothetical protein
MTKLEKVGSEIFVMVAGLFIVRRGKEKDPSNFRVFSPGRSLLIPRRRVPIGQGHASSPSTHPTGQLAVAKNLVVGWKDGWQITNECTRDL